ncbi:NEDD4-binding protein 1-like isoform X2 [Limulus polyphemus]|uniref:NEDD4-binding protein 1-like isoform X2 n=1 Tax=Limulus polyphemus TaxID=6850 RepID=A0ABM1SI40_LIMPO|nr:NEDD4-binding protein 1-like isoform X2 [Limulus polyphemus]
MQVQKVNNSRARQKDFFLGSRASVDSFSEKDDSVIIIEEKKGSSQNADASVIEIDCDISNLSIIEIDSDVSVPDTQECSTISSKFIKNIQKNKQMTSACNDENNKNVNNSTTLVDSAGSKFDDQFVKTNPANEETKVLNKTYKNHKKKRQIRRKKKKRISAGSINTPKYKTSKILKSLCKRHSKLIKSSKSISMFKSGTLITNEKSFNHLEEKQMISLTLSNIKDTPVMCTKSSETSHSFSCDKGNAVNCKKSNDWKGQIESKTTPSALQDNAPVPLSQGHSTSMKITVPVQMKRLRPIVIDGSNIAMSHGKPRKVFSCRGIELSINYFRDRGHHDIVAFVPQHRRSKSWSNKITDQHLLEALSDKQLIVFTPSRKINKKFVSSYDDRLLMYCFVGDHFMIPSDPLGKDGPHLDDFLAFQ